MSPNLGNTHLVIMGAFPFALSFILLLSLFWCPILFLVFSNYYVSIVGKWISGSEDTFSADADCLHVVKWKFHVY